MRFRGAKSVGTRTRFATPFRRPPASLSAARSATKSHRPCTAALRMLRHTRKSPAKRRCLERDRRIVGGAPTRCVSMELGYCRATALSSRGRAVRDCPEFQGIRQRTVRPCPR